MLHRRKGLPDRWLEIVEDHVSVWHLLDAGDRERLETTSDWLLRHKHWEAARGFALSDDITVTIAAQAALLVLGLSVDEYRELSAIIVYPMGMLSQGARVGPARGTATDGDLPILGEAHDHRGPVLVAWDQAEAASRHLGNGQNVVLHELAHKLDMANGLVNGTPPLGSRVDPDRWRDVCTEAFEALAAGVDRPPLQPYGATNPAEFFAVATEAFFDVPVQLRHHEPDLYEILRDFYRQDPGARVRS
ncbi:MAG TPA: M90 family metallopeptidase [Acidimicrobiia bacterium]|nr:M90 family metallopeptidase [Acidimicrobiia bacterium]